MNHQLYDSCKLIPLDERDRELEELWGELADVPMNPETECMEEPFLHFPAGTNREDIWKWFDCRYTGGVAALLYGDGVDRTRKSAMLLYYSELCDDCESHSCAYNSAGECRYPMVHHRVPNITEEQGCLDSCVDLFQGIWD